MRFGDSNVDVSGVNDLRGGGGGRIAAGSGGLGIVGLLIYLAFSAFGGGGGGGGVTAGLDPGGLGGLERMQGTGETRQELAARCNSEGAIEQYDDCFLIKVYNEVNDVWAEEVSGYREPSLTFFTSGVRSGCGLASSAVGPFYCPPDEAVYIDIGFLEQLQATYGAEGRYAQAYIMAHEVGHHLQTLLGTEREIRRLQQQDPGNANLYSVRLELQADCYAGVWGRLADERGYVAITPTELQQALDAAEAVGDDRIQQQAQGQVDPDSFTHGTAEQRRQAYLAGFETGRAQACALDG